MHETTKKQYGEIYYSRLCFPEPGGALEQSSLIMEIFSIIKDELILCNMRGLHG